ncbi:ATP-binding protein [Roseococcus pinisoli]|uniref:histidine kinase n=1 Tax=Roseococcus pinisoli TaxID=2835040 RepID=A0ABS5QA50_9PROT|nr:ATP-binding protein [Roseococcus pinisoli]MBS7810362.1 two-component sensor histidine kinase [Roseococcus pinisoli]
MGGLLAMAALIGGAPTVVLVTLAALGELRAGTALAAILLCLTAALALSWLWLSGMARLAAVLLRAADEEGPFSAPLPLPRLPAIGRVEEGLGRLARSLAARAALVTQLRASDGAIVEALPDPLLILGADRSLLRANTAARRVFGLQRDMAARGDLGALLRHPLMAAALDHALADDRPQATELALPGALTRELSAQVLALNPPLADGGKLLVVLTDRTAARAVERMRVDFIANASHELRTPLASIIGFIETLRGPAKDDPVAQERFLGIMAEQSERMRRLIDDLLGLSRVEISEHQAPEGEADLTALLQAEAAALEPLFAARRIHLALALPEAPLLAAPADADQLAQVARNLLDNALRHATHEVRLEAGPARHGNRDGVTFSVIDDGPGIPREHLPRLTERFYRVDKARARGVGNTGLGLAIVKHILARHRGQLSIDSEIGQGSTFKVWVPGK